MEIALKEAVVAFKEYCKAFNLTPVTSPDVISKWRPTFGQIVAAAFVGDIQGKDGQPPVAFILLDGTIIIEQDEDDIPTTAPALVTLSAAKLREITKLGRAIHVMG